MNKRSLTALAFGSLGARLLFASAILSLNVGCGGSPQVRSSELPVHRVVVYRNGVAYFERRGEVDSESVHFQLRKENVGDFLATLAVLERGGHTVRAASFPVSMDDPDQADDPALMEALNSWERKKTDKRELRRVTLELDGEQHDLTVGYLAETPLWRPSYRLVVGEKGEAVLQAWGIVQNQSGEDWNNVEIALVAGAPIAFESTLGEPVIPRRPVVTDQGEVISAVPQGETTLYQSDDAGEAAPAEEMMEEGMADMAEAEARDESSSGMRMMKRSAGGSGNPASPMGAVATSGAPAPAPSMAPRAESAMARVELQTGATRYEVPHRVTIPDKSATMVLLISKKVPGEAVFLFAPDGGVPGSSVHPFRVARFKNASKGMLERGPIAVFEKGAFLGQGVVESLPINGRATVPFALMRSLSIKKETTHDQRGSRLYSVEDGQLTVESDQATIVEYKVTNGDAERARVLLRHPLSSGAKLWDPPKGTEELASEQAALLPVDVPGFGKARLMAEERRPIQRRVDWQSVEARAAIREFLKMEAPTPALQKTLDEILEHAAQLSTLEDNERILVLEQRELEKSTRETRLSLEAIEKNRQATELRRELVDRLSDGTKRLEEITKELVELRLRRTEREVRLKEAKKDLTIAPPDQRKKK